MLGWIADNAITIIAISIILIMIVIAIVINLIILKNMMNVRQKII